MRVLIAEDFEDMLDLLEFIFSKELHFNTVLASSGRQAIEILQKDDSFDLIVCDLHMRDGSGAEVFQFHHKRGMECPFILLARERTEGYQNLKSSRLHWISKPFAIQDFVGKVREILSISDRASDFYVPVSLALLKKIQKIEIPLYIRINDHKYVKVTGGPAEFNDAEYDKYHARGLRYLYVESSSADALIESYRKKVLSMEAWNSASAQEHEAISLNIELLKALSDTLGWDHRMVDLARESLHKALHLIKLNPELTHLISQFHKIERYGFSDHCALLMMVSSGLLHALGYNDNTTLAKITFAAVMHDMNLTDEQYQNKQKVIKQIKKGEPLSPLAKVIHEHPFRAAEMTKRWSFCPPDVDVLILNHHERPDGTGFPAQKKSADLDFVSSIFILAEDFTDYFLEFYGKPDLNEYVESRRALFDGGYFRSVFHVLETAIQLHKSRAG